MSVPEWCLLVTVAVALACLGGLWHQASGIDALRARVRELEAWKRRHDGPDDADDAAGW